MARTPAPPLGRFSRQIIGHTLDRLSEAGRDASGRWLASQIDMSHTYVAKRLRFELPFTTTDVERIAAAFDMSAAAYVDAAVGEATPPMANVTRLEDHAAVTIHTEGVRSADKLAAKKGRRKADEPHAE
ncbi:helix-turn-helix domain-containing protein [Agrococcus casei]|uniref:Transcription regulator BetR N-terminal domain-containing protein n=1 Tax=Agrococcus casei LMG 22410 TaxID=1255656 RepID=A0A1R4FFX8_9MICO|nr:helix-turn-helix domain-containing protein [Agrococcus casei]SJM54798.1 hypothetical protein CZ674_04320 [Agrococcus casei LMG 22410]